MRLYLPIKKLIQSSRLSHHGFEILASLHVGYCRITFWDQLCIQIVDLADWWRSEPFETTVGSMEDMS